MFVRDSLLIAYMLRTFVLILFTFIYADMLTAMLELCIFIFFFTLNFHHFCNLFVHTIDDLLCVDVCVNCLLTVFN